MAAKFILVEVTKNRLIELRTVKKNEIPAVLKGKKSNQYIYSSQSYKAARKEISDHNSKVEPTPIQISKDPKEKKSLKRNTILIWDWTKLTDNKRKEIKKLYGQKKYLQIFKIHNGLKLSNVNYCCDSYSRWVDYNIKKGVENGFL